MTLASVLLYISNSSVSLDLQKKVVSCVEAVAERRGFLVLHPLAPQGARHRVEVQVARARGARAAAAALGGEAEPAVVVPERAHLAAAALLGRARQGAAVGAAAALLGPPAQVLDAEAPVAEGRAVHVLRALELRRRPVEQKLRHLGALLLGHGEEGLPVEPAQRLHPLAQGHVGAVRRRQRAEDHAQRQPRLLHLHHQVLQPLLGEHLIAEVGGPLEGAAQVVLRHSAEPRRF
mmetsp:Transcript_25545/g.40168  ORF Transcript_25545/g.40168 Transcript_25545/m.40168 type:complete len:234 (-) Transcript_25545:82-783(-)